MIREGTTVKWKWGNGYAQGKVVESHSSEITRTFEGTDVTRKGEEGNKALVIEQEDGTQVLKLENEVARAD
ncbi:hypothetical protein SAMN04490243_1573 [Robiginitalea myxolifaciens]|uniref:Hypervirulence associated protein TUDOR domain-containing protein n=1 Tax=Robiginitalea myxolifaciens TaxID=400055 RepID=A0A1I6GCC1_9FLAO|nr:DUF2945 domain-containing protein [Robiginitalea myxolifaciens]SFR39839.1 hypothetical protein SAMN04490243_1573 [Robiginitalea myxolifaciens]